MCTEILRQVVQIGPETKEDEVWSSTILPHVMDLPENVRSICTYGFTEILNNVIDHSGSARATLVLERSDNKIRLRVMDLGIGIFRKIWRALHAEHDRFLERRPRFGASGLADAELAAVRAGVS